MTVNVTVVDTIDTILLLIRLAIELDYEHISSSLTLVRHQLHYSKMHT